MKLIENYLKLLIVEDDPKTCDNFYNLIDQISELNLVGITNNAKEAFLLIKDCLPDVVILDLELHIGGGNGIDILKETHSSGLSLMPYFIITTNNTSSTTYEIARKFGADFIMYKHEEGYCEKNVLNFINTISSTILKRFNNKEIELESPRKQHNRIINSIHSHLDLIGISPKVKGYYYLTDAILLSYNGDSYHLCQKVAQLHQVSEPSVERAMQNAINKAWNTNDIDTLSQYYTGKIHSEKGMPTVSEFVHYYANRLKNR